MIRPFEQQSRLERVLRSFLWHPQDQLKRCQASLPKHVKKKEYKEAGECLDSIRASENQIRQWEYILELYESELLSPDLPLCGDGAGI